MIKLDEIKKLPIREKLLLMETLWDDLSRSEDQIEVPDWHKDVLDEREELIRSDQATFIDWEASKKQIRDAIS